MNEHAGLIKEARDLAFINDAWSRPVGKTRDAIRRNHKDVATMLRRLAGVIEARDNKPSLQAVNDEAVAACKTCGEVIAMFIDEYPCRERDIWANLRAAGHLAKRAAELADEAEGGA